MRVSLLTYENATQSGANPLARRTTLHVATPAGPGAEVGTATVNDSPQGAMITLDLHGLPPG